MVNGKATKREGFMPEHHVHDKISGVVGNGRRKPGRPLIGILLIDSPEKMRRFSEIKIRQAWGKFKNQRHVHFCLVDKQEPVRRIGQSLSLKHATAEEIWKEISQVINFWNEYPDIKAIFVFGEIPAEYVYLFQMKRIKRLIKPTKNGHSLKHLKVPSRLKPLTARLRQLSSRSKSA